MGLSVRFGQYSSGCGRVFIIYVFYGLGRYFSKDFRGCTIIRRVAANMSYRAGLQGCGGLHTVFLYFFRDVSSVLYVRFRVHGTSVQYHYHGLRGSVFRLVFAPSSVV